MEELDLLTGLATTRSIRRIRPDPIPDDDLATILWHATRAPSGSNRQPVRFIVLRDGPNAVEAKRLLGTAFRDGWALKSSAEGYDARSGQEPTSRKARQARAMAHFVEHFEKIPVVVLACLVPHRPIDLYLGASVYPACHNLLLAARAIGYGGVITMWQAMVDGALRELLDIPKEAVLAATIPLGRPEGNHGPVRRRPLGDVVFEDGWGHRAVWAVDPPGTAFAGGPPQRPADT